MTHLALKHLIGRNEVATLSHDAEDIVVLGELGALEEEGKAAGVDEQGHPRVRLGVRLGVRVKVGRVVVGDQDPLAEPW